MSLFCSLIKLWLIFVLQFKHGAVPCSLDFVIGNRLCPVNFLWHTQTHTLTSHCLVFFSGFADLQVLMMFWVSVSFGLIEVLIDPLEQLKVSKSEKQIQALKYKCELVVGEIVNCFILECCTHINSKFGTCVWCQGHLRVTYRLVLSSVLPVMKYRNHRTQ